MRPRLAGVLFAGVGLIVSSCGTHAAARTASEDAAGSGG